MSGHVYPEEPSLHPPTPHKCRRFEGKVVVMTAATKGLAYATAIRFAEEGEACPLNHALHSVLSHEDRGCTMNLRACGRQ